jgi:hypothetical protein
MKMSKKQLKTLIKECVKEVVFEEGFLSGIISEVVVGLNKTPLVENKKEQNIFKKSPTQFKKDAAATRKRLLEVAGKNTHGGTDLFEGTTPLTKTQSEGNSSQGPLSNVDPKDAGINIDNIPGANMWKHLIK